MQNVLLAIIVAWLPATAAAAGQSGQHRSYKSPSPRSHALKSAARGSRCAAYGPGFVRIEGSETCLKLGGGIGVGGGISGGSP
jgi:hypothetical protein